MFDDQGKLRYKLYQPGAVLSVLPAKKILRSKEHQMLLRYIRDYSDVPAEYYPPLYEQLIFDYAEFVQHLPIESEAYLGSLFNVGLTRALSALYRHQSAKKNRLDMKSNDHLITYAIFTAALFSSISAVISNQQILITDRQGMIQKVWNPYDGSLTAIKAKHYKIRLRSAIYAAVEHWIKPVLARQLLSQEGFRWLSSDIRVFNDWLAALQGEVIAGGQVSDLLHYIRRLDDAVIGLDIERLPPIETDMHMPQEIELAEKFLKWLQKALEQKKLTVNQPNSMVHMIDQGVFLLESDLYRYFLKHAASSSESLMRSTAMTAQMQYALANLQRISCFAQFDQQAKRFGAVFMTQQSAMKTGVLVSDPSLIFKGDVPPVSPYFQANCKGLQVSLPNLQRLHLSQEESPKGRMF
jgi:hypothetical protein